MSDKSEKILNIATKRGFFYPTAEIYTARAGFWTFGHLGTLMKKKWENLWRDYFLNLNDNYFEIEGSYILPTKVFKSSGHLEHFNDPLTQCKKCKFRFRADQLIEDKLLSNVEGLKPKALDKLIKDNNLSCPSCGSHSLGNIQLFNMMFDVKIGALGEEKAYLSPETAQNPYLSFKRQTLALREKLPMGLAMIGKAFRNEISPRQGFFRLREFNQAELQIFFNPSKDEVENWSKIKNYKLRLFLVKNRKQNKITEISCEEANKKLKLSKLYLYNAAKIQQFYLKLLKIPKDKFRFRELSKEERAFYNKIHFDIEINLETLGGFKEVAGLHYRGDHDLLGHQEGSKEKLEITQNNEKILPHVLELSFGIDRNIWALLDVFYKKEKERTIFTFPPVISPFETTTFPLVKNNKKLVKESKEVYNLIRKDFKTFYDETASIGRRYARQDEIGTPYCITIDFDSLKKKDVTLRDRDTTKQIRVKVKNLKDTLRKLLNQEIKFSKAGKLIK